LLLAEIANIASRDGISLGELAVSLESEESGISPAEVRSRMAAFLMVMRQAAEEGLSHAERTSRSRLSGGDAYKVMNRYIEGNIFPGNEVLARSVAYALAISETNASMGKIVAAPTAGSCGVIPGCFLSVAQALNLSDDVLIDSLCAAGIIGQCIASKASLSGAEGGCQAECGSAAAMAAAGLAQMGGGSPVVCINAAAIAIKGLTGLVCDPVAGLVEVPCVKRNATSAAVALASAEMALSGVTSVIPPDEVVQAMAQVGRSIPESLRETSMGGLAATQTAQLLAKTILGQ